METSVNRGSAPPKDILENAPIDNAAAEEAIIDASSTDIRGGMEKVLDGDFLECYKGSFAFCRTYRDAPNPGLSFSFNDIGTVGLPLSTREANAILSAIPGSPFTRVEQSDLDAKAANGWELDGVHAKFVYPEWKTYIKRIVDDVCAALGIDITLTKPRHKLRKVILCDPGSILLPRVQSESATTSTAFATITVLLPSFFTGLVAKLSHGHTSQAYDLSEKTLYTTVLAQYADVPCSTTPITSGYTLALSYDVVHTTATPRPSLPTDLNAVEALRHVLISWKQADRTMAPDKIVYLLDGYYRKNPRASVLEGVDARRVKALRMLAMQCGFRLGLAHLEIERCGTADDHGPRHQCLEYNESDTEEEDDGTVDDFAGGPDEILATVTNLVNLDGTLLLEKLAFDLDNDHSIPTDIGEAVAERDYCTREYEGYQRDRYGGGRAGFLQLGYHRTVLVIWPQFISLEMTFDDDIDSAFTTLRKADSARPTETEHALVKTLVKVAADGRRRTHDIARNLSTVAYRWFDLSLWIRVVDLCGPSHAAFVLCDGLVSAIQAFKFGAVRTTFENMLRSAQSNAHRFGFLDTLADAEDGICNGDVLPWLTGQRAWALENLAAPSEEDPSVLLSIAYKHGGPACLRDIFLHQLKENSSPDFLLSFALCIWTEKVQKSGLEDDDSVTAALVAALLRAAVSKADFDVPVEVTPPTGSDAVPSLKPSPAMVIRYFDACLQTGNEALVDDIVDRLTDTSRATPSSTGSQQTRIRVQCVLLPLLPVLGARLQTRPSGAPPIPGVDKLFEATFQLFTESPPFGLSKSDVDNIVETCVLYGGSGFLAYTVWPALMTLPPYREPTMLAFLQALQDDLHRIPLSDAAPTPGMLATEVLKLIITEAGFNRYPTSHYDSKTGRTGPSQDNRSKAIALLRLCVKHGQTGLCSAVLARMFDRSFVDSDYIQKVLVPFIPELRQFLVSNNISPCDEPFDMVFTSIVKLWATHDLGPKPANPPDSILANLQRNACRCRHCLDVFDFLLRGEGKTRTFEQLGLPKCNHLATQLASYAPGAATWSVTRGFHQGLEVKKADVLYQPLRWMTAQAQGQAILRSVSMDQNELQRILGDSYQELMNTLDGQPDTAQRTTHLVPTAATASGFATGAGLRFSSDTAVPLVANPAPAPTSASQLPGLATRESRKRKASQLETGDVIDLTTMSP
ncbi:hypothetical protein BD626DRAFT_624815 [Schizophyllum amplum]|uniref:Uncharacterized protein n=1 Tax=Schizophyllum amplum TaxID=97359 RepID=A0A550CXH8_9AGAR|nr:hypothetical protein BD626DRAFT_624815 [Auriculariopsis ampla]